MTLVKAAGLLPTVSRQFCPVHKVLDDLQLQILPVVWGLIVTITSSHRLCVLHILRSIFA